MREIDCASITTTVARLCREANLYLGEDVLQALEQARAREPSPLGLEALSQILENARLAPQLGLPLCQDCGIPVIFLEVGQEVHIVGGQLYQAVEEGVRQGYRQGYLRCSMVWQPFSARVNTADGTPAVIHTEIVEGEQLKLWFMPKGAGAENMSRLAMLPPAAGQEGIIDFVLKTVEEAGSSPCPPVIVGVGIGGTAEKAVLLAKKALLRQVGQPHADAEVSALEREFLTRINTLGIGPEGFGGKVTALAVHTEVFPSHIASLPVAVNIQCHCARHKEAVL